MIYLLSQLLIYYNTFKWQMQLFSTSICSFRLNRVIQVTHACNEFTARSVIHLRYLPDVMKTDRANLQNCSCADMLKKLPRFARKYTLQATSGGQQLSLTLQNHLQIRERQACAPFFSQTCSRGVNSNTDLNVRSLTPPSLCSLTFAG